MAGWVAAGATLNEIQKKLKEELDIGMTYLDTRFLISDLGLTLRDLKAEEKARDEAKAGESAVIGEPEEGFDSGGDSPPGAGGVRVTSDSIAQPGMLVSGKVTFSDGEDAQWYFDQMGQLGLVPATPGYQPSEPDVLAFQRELRTVLQRNGMA